MSRRNHLPHLLGIAIVALLVGTSSVHSQTAGTSGAAGAAGQSGAGAGTADKSAGTQAGGGKLSKADAGMLRDMANINVSEVATAKIAMEKSKNEHVLAYAKQMEDDHSKSQSELTQLAQGKGVTLPTEPDKKHQAAAKKLSALSGEEFDRAYIKEAGVQDHTNARKTVMRVRDKATDPDVKAAAEKMLPTIEQHLKMAKELPVGKAGGGAKPETGGEKGGK